MITVSAAFEDDFHLAVLRRLAGTCGFELGDLDGFTNRSTILVGSLPYILRLSCTEPWLVLVDLDQDECAPHLLREAIPEPSEYLIVRIAVKEVEAWLLADCEGIARFLRVSQSRVNSQPQQLEDPKNFLLHMAAHSSKAEISKLAKDILAGKKNYHPFSTLMIEYVERNWDPIRAAQRCDSLSRCILSLSTTLPSWELSLRSGQRSTWL